MIFAVDKDYTVAIVATVLAAALTAIGLLGRSFVRFLIDLRDEMRTKLGTPNGQGNVTEMLESLLTGQSGQDTRIARLEAKVNERAPVIQSIEKVHEDGAARSARLDRHQAEIDDLKASQRSQGSRIGGLEAEVSVLKGAPCYGDSPPG